VLADDRGEVMAACQKIIRDLLNQFSYNVMLSDGLRAENDHAFKSTILGMTLGLGSIMLVVGALGFYVARDVKRSLNGIETTMSNAGQSLDLTCEANIERMDEIGKTAAAFNSLLSNIKNAMRTVVDSSDHVSNAAREIASGNTNLSSRTEEQAASLEQAASSMTQLTETVRRNADNSMQASTLAANATRLADGGNDAVISMVAVIERINESSIKVSEIIGVIEGIAFQTNILALNASVEAARAGEHGRGFAVVASEVRELAQRSAAAAKEIKDLISSSVTMIQEGTHQATEVGETVGQVKLAIKQVSEIVTEIASASEEQSKDIEQINLAVHQMDEGTQQNAALVEQVAAAAQSLADQASTLKDAVSAFKLANATPHFGLPASSRERSDEWNVTMSQETSGRSARRQRKFEQRSLPRSRNESHA